MLRVVMKLKMKGKRPRGIPILRWLDNIDSHLKGKNTSLKKVLDTKCFENRKDWRTCYALFRLDNVRHSQLCPQLDVSDKYYTAILCITDLQSLEER